MKYIRITEEDIKDNNHSYGFDIDWNKQIPTFNNLDLIHLIIIPKFFNSEYEAVLFIPIIYNEKIGIHGVEQYRLLKDELDIVNKFLEEEKEFSYERITSFLSENIKDKPLVEPITL